eukprot:TRINITY_DN2204_c0_g1_i1.p1 TRINITY_DN2204_c0_g1~~TRINITY_DN2204_c0_g1_i1.p1  ORF type:complete len:145 (+),score=33.26 TRINITY_DN2204_c0_g1_i1:31-435(+)
MQFPAAHEAQSTTSTFRKDHVHNVRVDDVLLCRFIKSSFVTGDRFVNQRTQFGRTALRKHCIKRSNKNSGRRCGGNRSVAFPSLFAQDNWSHSLTGQHVNSGSCWKPHSSPEDKLHNGKQTDEVMKPYMKSGDT